MTNYNERLDKLLANLVNQVAANEQRLLNGNATREETIDSDSNATMRAEQAITSLIKELVAEAKPLLKEKIASIEFIIWDRKTKVVGTFESETDLGFNKVINEFEQNLLKALEENSEA
jgi:hypothetical protein